MLTQEHTLSDARPQTWTAERRLTSRTFPTQYVGRLVFKPIMRDLAECARREGLLLSVETRRWVFTIVTTITVSGDANAVERFGWFNEMVARRYAFGVMC
jgi:hypothetical protein